VTPFNSWMSMYIGIAFSVYCVLPAR
jgi:hypothetical protein